MYTIKKKKRKSNVVLKLVSILIVGFVIIYFAFFKEPFMRSIKSLLSSGTITSDSNDTKEKVVTKSVDQKKEEINQNKTAYPKDLVQLAMKRDEVVDFVYNYPQNKDKFKDKEISIKNDYKKGQIPLFMQWDDRWGYDTYGDGLLGYTGCAPTAMSMAIVGLTGDTSATPRALAKLSMQNNFYFDGAGTKWDFIPFAASHYGITATATPVTETNITNMLKNGNIIIMSVKPGHFTDSGHFILLTGITSDGKITVNDPFSKIRSNTKWDMDVFINEAAGMWTLTK